jgi:hypothetical protein
MSFHSTFRLSRIALLLALATSAHAEPPARAVEMADASHVRLLPGSPFHPSISFLHPTYLGDPRIQKFRAIGD